MACQLPLNDKNQKELDKGNTVYSWLKILVFILTRIPSLIDQNLWQKKQKNILKIIQDTEGGLSFKREPYRSKTRTFFRDFNIKNHNLMEFIRKARTVPRWVFMWKIIKDRYLCGTVRARYLAVNNEIFSNTVRFSLLTFLPEKRWILGKKIQTITENGRVRYSPVLWIKSDSLPYNFLKFTKINI